MEKKLKEIVWTTPAKKDLQKISNHFSTITETIAYKLIIRILDKAARLDIGFYSIGQEEPLLIHLKKNYRYLVIGNYKIIYQVDESDLCYGCF